MRFRPLSRQISRGGCGSKVMTSAFEEDLEPMMAARGYRGMLQEDRVSVSPIPNTAQGRRRESNLLRCR